MNELLVILAVLGGVIALFMVLSFLWAVYNIWKVWSE